MKLDLTIYNLQALCARHHVLNADSLREAREKTPLGESETVLAIARLDMPQSEPEPEPTLKQRFCKLAVMFEEQSEPQPVAIA